MLNKRSLKLILTILAIEVLTVPIVIALFKFIEPKKLAALNAAVLFVSTGLVILYLVRKIADYFSYATYWMINVQLFVFTIPMFLARAFFWEKDFAVIKIFFFTGPEFHKIAEKAYLFLLIATVVDVVRVLRSRKNKS